jgi:EAL domain-containing protein (putative c-di-GMP-specific phosphodiesterase class I)
MAAVLGDWTVEAVAAALTRWRGEDLPHRLCFGISQPQLQRQDFIERLREALASSGPPPWNVEIELDEAAAAGCDRWTRAALDKLRRDGVSIAVSGFGGRRSGARLPYVLPGRPGPPRLGAARGDRPLRTRPGRRRVARPPRPGPRLRSGRLADFPHDQVELLRVIGCDEVQGFFGIEPMGEDAFLAWTQAQDCARKPRSG